MALLNIDGLLFGYFSGFESFFILKFNLVWFFFFNLRSQREEAALCLDGGMDGDVVV
jgi:hypothetical protein